MAEQQRGAEIIGHVHKNFCLKKIQFSRRKFDKISNIQMQESEPETSKNHPRVPCDQVCSITRKSVH